MKSEEELIADFEKISKKLLKTIKELKKIDESIIIKCQDNMFTLCRDNGDDLDCVDYISSGIDFTGYMETVS